MNSISVTSKKSNMLAKEISLALILRNFEGIDENLKLNSLVHEIYSLLEVSKSDFSSAEYSTQHKLFEVLANPENTLTFSEGLGRNGILTIYILGESELRYSINIINPDLNAIRDYESFVNDSPKYAYTFFFKDLLNEKSLKNIDFQVIQQIMSSLNVWHGDIEIFGGVQPSIFIEDNSNNPEKEFFKTIIQSVKIQAALTPYAKDSEGTMISTKVSYKADLNISLISDIFKDKTILRNISVDISFEDKNAVNKFSTLRNYSTKITENNHLFGEIYELFEKLKG